jgi:shingomyelin synthase
MADPMFFLPQQGWAYILGDWMVSLSFTSLCLLLVFHRHRFLLFRRILFILALLNTLRSMMILLTRLPSSYADNASRCRTQMPNNRTAALLLERTWEQAIGLGLQDGAHKMLCGDQMLAIIGFIGP